ncbi:MAG: DUF3073 domain-containing protein [Pseudoclavibacter sp.]
MGRGRQKAKHTKVARELKYSVHETNYDALARELSGGSSSYPATPPATEEPNDDILSKWSEYLDDDDADEDDDTSGYEQKRA